MAGAGAGRHLVMADDYGDFAWKTSRLWISPLATDLRLRDKADQSRMEPAPDAQRIDTTDLEIEHVIARIEELVRTRTAI